jgi:HTH-type transcriptional regulator/antitoxin HigA
MEIHPVRSRADYDAAVAEIQRLWGAGADPGTDDGDKLDILATLVEKYENEHWPIDTSRVDPIDTLNYLIDEGGIHKRSLPNCWALARVLRRY